MNNTKRIHAKKFYIPLYIPPLNFFRKYNSSILILIHRAPNFPGIKSREKHLKAFFATFQHFSRKADNKNAIRTDSKTGCTNVIIVSAVLNSTLGRGAILH